MEAAVEDLETPHGTARAHVLPVQAPVGALALGHGAAGSVSARDLVAAAAAAREARLTVVLVEQPYRVAGRRSPPPAAKLDAVWIAVIDALRASTLHRLPLITGGRSSGARVACRTAGDTDARGVLCLAFPLLAPPPKAGGERKTRLPELDAVSVPTLVIQGKSDRFGMPPDNANRTVAQIIGDHRLTSDLPALGAAIRDWLPKVVSPR